jgi:hypothetical protein
VSTTATKVGTLAAGPTAKPDAEHRQLDRHADDDRAAGQRVSSAPRTPARRSTAPGGSGGNARLGIGLIVDFALLKHVS